MSQTRGPETVDPVRPATVASIALLVIVLSPIIQNWREDPVDGFPLSYFPMFTTVREGRTRLTHPIGIRADGSEVSLHYKVVGSGGMNQVRRQIRSRVKRGEAEELCREIAERVARSDRQEHRDLVAVAVVRDRFELDAFFSGDRTPAERDIRARVEIPRGSEQ